MKLQCSIATLSRRDKSEEKSLDEKGVAILEFALTLPILVLLFMGLTEAALMSEAYMSLSEVAREDVSQGLRFSGIKYVEGDGRQDLRGVVRGTQTNLVPSTVDLLDKYFLCGKRPPNSQPDLLADWETFNLDVNCGHLRMQYQVYLLTQNGFGRIKNIENITTSRGADPHAAWLLTTSIQAKYNGILPIFDGLVLEVNEAIR